MIPARMSLPAKLTVVLGAAMAGIAAWYGNEALAVMSALVAWQSHRLARLAVQARNAMESAKDAMNALNLLSASQKAIIELQAKELEFQRKEVLIREAAFDEYVRRTETAVGAAQMILNGRK